MVGREGEDPCRCTLSLLDMSRNVSKNGKLGDAKQSGKNVHSNLQILISTQYSRSIKNTCCRNHIPQHVLSTSSVDPLFGASHTSAWWRFTILCSIEDADQDVGEDRPRTQTLARNLFAKRSLNPRYRHLQKVLPRQVALDSRTLVFPRKFRISESSESFQLIAITRLFWCNRNACGH